MRLIKYILFGMIAVVLAAFAWDSQRLTMQKLEANADSAAGLDAKVARSFLRERLIDICHDAADRKTVTELSESDCVLAVERKDMLCSMKMQVKLGLGQQTIHSATAFREFAETYIACLEPNNTDYVGPNSFPTGTVKQ